ncbi:MAG: LysM peptidoglycan-binding domain-containing protein [Planctomycetaceae bacterium]|nr:LysM peptidoglycan-binding domain-containing protein [Planctomycetaceae bacterium]
MESQITPSASPILEPVTADDAEKGPSLVSKIGAFCSGCCGTIATCSTTVAAKTWGWCKTSAQWTWSGIKAIPSYCVLRRATEEENEVDKIEPPANTNTNANTNAIVTSPETDKPAFSFVSFVKSLRPSWLKYPQRTQRTHEEHKEEQYEEDELAPSRWWSFGFKTAAAVVAVLILVGGYFVAKPFFNAPMDEMAGEMETVELTDQSPLLAQNDTSPAMSVPPPVEPLAWEAPVAPVVAAPEPMVAQQVADIPPTPPVVVPVEVPVPQQQPQPDPFAVTVPSPPQGSFIDDSVFAQQTPVVPVGGDPFGVVQPEVVSQEIIAQEIVTTVEQPTPEVAAVVENVAAPAPAPAATFPTLSPLETVQSVNPQPNLQPLAVVGNSAFPTTPVANAPVAVPATVNAPVASVYVPQNPLTSSPPVPPAISPLPQTAMSQTAIERTVPIAEPVREIVPMIQRTGTIENVLPPMVEVAAEPRQNDAEYRLNGETAPAIPRDAPLSTSPPVVVVPAAVPVANSQPIDWQLWEQVNELRNRAEMEPTQLRLDETVATAEPALRFTSQQTTPQQTAPQASDDNLLTRAAMNSFGDLMPSSSSDEIALILPALENAPQPRWAELAPAYRDDAMNQPNGEGGRTFQNQINSEVSRSPSATETYTVQQGDTYMTISDRFYGTSLLYDALARHNRQLGIGWRPAEGVVIEIPTAEFLRMHYGEATRQLDTQRPTVRYIVQEGDTIFRLATDKLQDSTRWREIYALNADRLQDVRDLRPGMEILLPAETAQRN